MESLGILKYILIYILGIVVFYIIYLIYVEITARFFLNVKRRMNELENKK